MLGSGRGEQLIVSETRAGSETFFSFVQKEIIQDTGDGLTKYLYRIRANNILGSSLNENFKLNQDGLFSNAAGETSYNLSWEQFTRVSNHANEMEEVHVFLNDIKPHDIEYIGQTTYL